MQPQPLMRWKTTSKDYCGFSSEHKQIRGVCAQYWTHTEIRLNNIFVVKTVLQFSVTVYTIIIEWFWFKKTTTKTTMLDYIRTKLKDINK